MAEIEEDRIKFRMHKQIFENIINICNRHNEQTLEINVQYNHPNCQIELIDKYKDRHMYLDIYIKTQLATLKDMSLYFNCSFNFGYTKFINIDELIISCNNVLRYKFDKYTIIGSNGSKFKFNDNDHENIYIYQLFKM